MKAYVVNIADDRAYDNEVASVVIATDRDDAIRLTLQRLDRRDLNEKDLEIDEVELVVGLVFVANGFDSTSIDVESYE